MLSQKTLALLMGGAKIGTPLIQLLMGYDAPEELSEAYEIAKRRSKYGISPEAPGIYRRGAATIYGRAATGQNALGSSLAARGTTDSSAADLGLATIEQGVGSNLEGLTIDLQKLDAEARQTALEQMYTIGGDISGKREAYYNSAMEALGMGLADLEDILAKKPENIIY